MDGLLSDLQGNEEVPQPFIQGDIGQDPFVPLGGIQVVCGVEEIVEFIASEVADGLAGRYFHLHGNAALLFPGSHVPTGLPEESVRCPGTALDIGNVQPVKYLTHQNVVSDFDVVPCGEIVVARALVPVGVGRDDELAAGEMLVQSAGGAEHDEFAAGKGVGQVFDQSGGKGSAHLGLDHANVGILVYIQIAGAGNELDGGFLHQFQQFILQQRVQDLVGKIDDAGIQLALPENVDFIRIDDGGSFRVKGMDNAHGGPPFGIFLPINNFRILTQ